MAPTLLLLVQVLIYTTEHTAGRTIRFFIRPMIRRVTACKYFSGITASTTAWKEGAAVSGNESIPIGTAIATFGSNGKYPTDGDQNSGIYLGPGSKPGSIKIFDQWPAYGAPLNTPANPPSIRQMRFNSNNGHSLANSASAYHVIIAP